MWNTFRLYWKLIGISIRSQMQHRASFLMLTVAYFLSTLVDILGIWVLFDRFKMVQGWTLEEVGLIYGVMHMGFAIAEASARGFDTFSETVKHGDFDRLLLRPIGTLFQVATSEVQWIRMGRFIQGLLVLLWSCQQLGIHFFSLTSGILAFAVVGTASLFYGLMVVQGALSFWTVETLELMNITTFGGLESGQYPMSIYRPSFRMFFTFVVPLACVAYYPVAVALHHEAFPLWAALVFPVTGLVFLYAACQFWHLGVRRYHSTGS